MTMNCSGLGFGQIMDVVFGHGVLIFPIVSNQLKLDLISPTNNLCSVASHKDLS